LIMGTEDETQKQADARERLEDEAEQAETDAPETDSEEPLTEETTMANLQTTATAKEKADAEHYIFSLGHSREDAEKHAARIGHKKVLQHQLDGENPLAEEAKDKK
jgi:hypothetical protein